MTRVDVTIMLKPKTECPVEVPVDYHSNVMSLLKYAINQYDPSKFHELFDTNTLKLYTWALDFPYRSKFYKDTITLSRNVLRLHMGFVRDDDADMFENALEDVSVLHMDKQLFGQDFEITGTSRKDDHVDGHTVNVRTMSNIAYEISEPNKKPFFLSIKDPRFQDIVLSPTLNKAQRFFMEDYDGYLQLQKDIINFRVTPIKAREVYNTIYGAKLPVTTGTFQLQGANYLINFLIAGGIGSITGSGFGMLKPTNMV